LVKIPQEFLLKLEGAKSLPEQLISKVYKDLDTRWRDADYILERAILAPKNDDVNLINELATDVFPGNATIYLSQDSIPEEDDNAGIYPVEFLNSLNPSGMQPHRLRLKVDQPIILIRNVDAKNGLCNGTRLICKTLGNHFIEAEVLAGQHRGKRVYIPRIPLYPSDTPDNGGCPIQFCRRQFPVRPAFAMTINKAQGQTLNEVGLYLPQPVFGHGQLYVALSRCTRAAGVTVAIEDGKIEGEEGAFTRNVVYKDVLQ
jgi:ATP-dependent DNA helicase PIF1